MCIYSKISLTCSWCTSSHRAVETQTCQGSAQLLRSVLGTDGHPHSLTTVHCQEGYTTSQMLPLHKGMAVSVREDLLQELW